MNEIDGSTAIAVGIGVYAAKDVIAKILGPTAEYLGEGSRDLVEKSFQNLGEIFKNAERKLDKDLNVDGRVPPKVLKSIVDSGAYVEDDIAIDYLGGVLAASRTPLGRDDRGASMARLVENLSTYQLRTHYFIYSAIRGRLEKMEGYLNEEARRKCAISISVSDLYSAIDFSVDERKNSVSLFTHIFFGLHSHGLIEVFRWGSKESLEKQFPNLNIPDEPDGTVVVVPSALGFQLFLWAFGFNDKSNDYIFDKDFDPSIAGVSEKFPDFSKIGIDKTLT